MASYGLNFVRLGNLVTGAYPAKGAFNDTYVSTMVSLVEAAAEHGIYVLIDAHQVCLPCLMFALLALLRLFACLGLLLSSPSGAFGALTRDRPRDFSGPGLLWSCFLRGRVPAVADRDPRSPSQPGVPRTLCPCLRLQRLDRGSCKGTQRLALWHSNPCVSTPALPGWVCCGTNALTSRL